MARIRKKISEIHLSEKEMNREIERMSSMPIAYDEDSPETTAELYRLYEPEAARQRAMREHPIIAFPAKTETLEQA